MSIDLPIPKGYKNLYLAKLLTDVSGGDTTYDTPFQLRGGANAVDTADNVDQAVYYSDDAANIVQNQKGDIDVTLTTKGLSDSEMSLILGQTVTDGFVRDNQFDEPPYFAVLYEISLSGGGSEFKQLHKVQFKPLSETTETAGDAVNFQPRELVGKAIPRLSDGERRKRALKETKAEADALRTTFFADANETTPPAFAVTPDPVDGASGVATSVAPTFTITGANEFLASTVNDGTVFLNEDGAGAVAVTLTVNPANTVITVTPDSALSAATAYTLNLTTGVTDKFGQSLASNLVVNFTTA